MCPRGGQDINIRFGRARCHVEPLRRTSKFHFRDGPCLSKKNQFHPREKRSRDPVMCCSSYPMRHLSSGGGFGPTEHVSARSGFGRLRYTRHSLTTRTIAHQQWRREGRDDRTPCIQRAECHRPESSGWLRTLRDPATSSA